ncbi:MAG: type III pantothenate kinase [Atribacterota bacterium]|nr:type III pantothenate kinase [Atribacterota bacterium]
MLLLIDVGNTHTNFGIYKDEELCGHWRIATDFKKTEDELAVLFISLMNEKKIEYKQIRAVVISCVVPPLIWILTKMSRVYFNIKPILVNSGINLNMKIRTDYPEEVGADRIVNAVAVCNLYHTPAIIIDYGTATTFCAVDKEKNYIGGAIAPGLELSSNALFEKTAKLPEVELIKPGQAIGKNTIQAIQSGIFLGHIGLTEEIISRFKAEIKGNPQVIATGGLSKLIGNNCSTIDIVDPLLTLKGLKIIYHLNS